MGSAVQSNLLPAWRRFHFSLSIETVTLRLGCHGAQPARTVRAGAIPDEVLEIYSLWRPTPLDRARRLEHAVGTRSRIFYKYEGVSPPGSHKPNTAMAVSDSPASYVPADAAA